jgi:hypothetical protein
MASDDNLSVFAVRVPVFPGESRSVARLVYQDPGNGHRGKRPAEERTRNVSSGRHAEDRSGPKRRNAPRDERCDYDAGVRNRVGEGKP